MKNTINLTITNCSQCPNCVGLGSYSLDGFDRGEDFKCNLTNKICGNFIERDSEWDKLEIPDFCPLLIKTNESNIVDKSDKSDKSDIDPLYEILKADSDLPKYGDLMDLQDWIKCCDRGYFIDDDGCGNLVYKDKVNETDVYPSDIFSIDSRYTHIIWFNK